jgi:hypothetical protein
MTVRGKRMVVEDVEEGGYLVNVGKRFFIDENFIKYTKPVTKMTSNKAVNYQVATGWHVIGFGTKGSYLRAPNGDILKAKVGTKLKGLGSVSKIDKDGVTYAGKYKVVVEKEKVF